MHDHKIKKLVSILLTIAMIFSMSAESALPAFAEETSGGSEGNPSQVSEVEVLEIRTFSAEMIYGADLNEEGDWVWDARTQASGHRFSYRIHYAISGQFELPEGSIEMRIPKHILKNRQGEWADSYEMSIPSKADLDRGEKLDPDINYVYYEDGDEIVIYNFREVFTGENGYIELSYFTSQSALSYIDYGAEGCESSEFFGTIKVQGNEREVSAETDHFTVNINSNARILSTDKRFPTKYDSWQQEWGTAPANSRDYYWLVWEVRSIINGDMTQPYHLTLNDYELSAGEIYGIRGAGQEVFTPGDVLVLEDQKLSGYRYDYVLTRHEKSWWDSQGDHVEITNRVEATLDPVDQVDPDTSAKSSVTFVWNRQQFIHPDGWFDSFKRADRSYKSEDGLNYLGMKADEYSRHDLEDLQNGRAAYLDNLDYAVWFLGYPYLYTVADPENDAGDPAKYFEQPVRYELYDYIFYLFDEDEGIDEPNVGTDNETYGIPKQEYIDNRLTYEDFQIDTLRFGTKYYQDADFNEDKQEFVGKQDSNGNPLVYYTPDDVLTFYALFGSANNPATDWIEVASIKLLNGAVTFDETYVKSMTPNAITFQDHCVGYKVETLSRHYATRIDLVPVIRLKNSDRVMAQIGESEAIGILNSETANFYAYNPESGAYDEKIITRSESATDYIRRSKTFSHIEKKVRSSSNSTKERVYTLKWAIKMDEVYSTGNGQQTRYVEQNGGTFYDLLPEGSVLNRASVSVESDAGYLPKSAYTVTIEENYENSGRALLTVSIENPGKYYHLFFDTHHSWASIRDWGNDIYNPVAYETGNDFLSPWNEEGYRGPARAAAFYEDFARDQENKFIYSEDSHDISIIMAAAANLHKKVKDASDIDYSYDTWTTTGSDYSYRWRFQNTESTKAKEMVFFDTMENYPVEQQDGSFKQSDWRGAFKSIDVSQLVSKGIEPFVYYSSIENLDLEIPENHDLTNTSVWQPLTDATDKSLVKALAVDARKKADGSDFVLPAGDSVSIVVHMKAPESLPFQGQGYPESYNNIYLENTIIDQEGGEAHFYIHQDYTVIRLLVAADIRVRKVNEENQSQMVPGITFRLFGTSNYGNEVDLKMTTGRDGTLVFSKVEMGSYILQEYEGTNDWLEDHREYRVVIGEDRSVTINGKPVGELEYYVITNKPRIHGDLVFFKRREGGNTPVDGAVFQLSGMSDYGNKVMLLATSSAVGRVAFENLDKGTYELKEIKSGERYLINKTVWTVRIDQRGKATIIPPEDPALQDRLYEIDTTGPTTSIYNEARYFTFFLRKVDEENPTILLEGAEFHLSGVSDLGHAFDLTAVSDENGLVTFANLEKGSYLLKETKAPTNVDEYGKLGGDRNYFARADEYIVTISAQGEVTIEGLSANPNGEFEVPNGRIYDGKIVVVKRWVDQLTGEDAADRPKPVLLLTTKDPSSRTITVQKTWADDAEEDRPEDIKVYVGKDGTENVVAESGNWVKSGDLWVGSVSFVEEPGAVYYLWEDAVPGYSSSHGIDDPLQIGGEATVAINNTKDEPTQEEGEPTTKLKYAVVIYGIGEDVNENGETMGLTFGPSVFHYTYSTIDESGYYGTRGELHFEHEPTGKTVDGNPHRCIHNDDWETIIYWNNQDPYVYEQCVAKSCSHAVELDFPEGFGNPYFDREYNPRIAKASADGTEAIGAELYSAKRRGSTFGENLLWNGVESSEGGWGASRMRAMMNGIDTNAADDGVVTNQEIANTLLNRIPVTSYVPGYTLLDAFPEALQGAIGKKAVKYATSGEKTPDNISTVYDKLWLLSTSESCSDNFTYSERNAAEWYNPYEGALYSKFRLTGKYYNKTDLYLSARSDRTSVTTNVSISIRSLHNNGEPLYFSGHVSYDSVYGDFTAQNISPCFTLESSYYGTHSVRPVDPSAKVGAVGVLGGGMGSLSGRYLIHGSRVRFLGDPTDIAGGTYGGVDWRITADGTLIFGEEGEVQTFTATSFSGEDWPLSINEYGTKSPYIDDIKRIKFAGTVKSGTALNRFFANAKVEEIDLTNFDTSACRDMLYMFNRTEVPYIDLSPLKTGNVTNMTHMFDGFIGKELDVRGLDTSSVTNMSFMFLSTEVDAITGLESFDTRMVTTMEELFSNTYAKEVNITGWDTSSVKNMSYMFAAPLERIIGIESLSTENCVTFSRMFAGVNLEELDVSHFDTRKLTDTSLMFRGATIRRFKGLENWETPSLRRMGQMFEEFTTDVIDISHFDTSNLYPESSSSVFDGATADQIILDGIDISQITSMYHWFRRVTVPVLDISSLDTSNVKYMTGLFAGSHIGELRGLEHLNTSNTTSMQDMFANTTFDVLDISTFESAPLYRLDGMFKGLKAKTIVGLDKLDLSQVRYYYDLFSECDLEYLDLSTLDTSELTAMSSWFKGSKIRHLDLSKLNTSKVTSMYSMFEDSELPDTDFSALDTSKVVGMQRMFRGAKTPVIDLSGWDTSRVSNMTRMFERCEAKIIDLTGFSTQRANDGYDGGLRAMFRGCYPEQITFSADMGGSTGTLFSTTNFSGEDWVRIRDAEGNLTLDNKTYTGADIRGLSAYSTPPLSGTWVRKSSPLYRQLDEVADYISEYGINENNHWVKQSDDTWTYTFDVFDDTLKYYLSELYLEGYESDVFAPYYTIVNEDEVTKTATITNTSDRMSASITITKDLEPGAKYVVDAGGSKQYTEEMSVIPETELARSFEFTIKLTGEGLSGRKVFDGVIFTDGIGKVLLKAGEEKTISHLPKDVTYEVLEKVPVDYDAAYENETGSLSHPIEKLNKVGEYISRTNNLDDFGNMLSNYGWEDNTYIRGYGRETAVNEAHVITVPGAVKLVVNIVAETAYDYYAWVCVWPGSHPEYTGGYYSEYNTSLSGQFGGARKSATYTIEGDTATISWYVSSSSTNSSRQNYGYYAVIKAYSNIYMEPDHQEVKVTNTYHQEDREPVDVTLRKEVSGNGSPDGDFTFIALLENLKPETLYLLSNGESFTSDENGSASHTISLGASEEVTIRDLPVGATYQILEEGGAYISSYEINSNGEGTVVKSSDQSTAEQMALSTSVETADAHEEVTITFTNRIEKYQNLSLTKRVVSADRKDKEFDFSLELWGLAPGGQYDSSFGRLLANGDGYLQQEMSIGDGARIEIFDLPVGARYRIAESDYSGEDFKAIISSNNENDTIGDLDAGGTITEGLDTAVLFVNVDRNTLKGTKVFEDLNLSHEDYAEEITLILKRTVDGETFEVVDLEPEWIENEFFFTDLPVEDESGNTYRYVVEEGPVADYSSAISYDEEAEAYTITNTRDSGKLVISKTVAGNSADPEKAFTFLITLTHADGKPINATIDGVEFEDGLGTITLKHGEQKELILPVGVSYTVEEIYEDYVPNSVFFSGTITKEVDQAADFVNTKNAYGSLSVTKKLSGNDTEKDRAFSFTVTLSEALSGTFGEMTFENGVAVFALKGGESKQASDLPPGLSYEVAEEDCRAEGYTTTSQNASGVIVAEGEAEAVFTNERNKEESSSESSSESSEESSESSSESSESSSESSDSSSESSESSTTPEPPDESEERSVEPPPEDSKTTPPTGDLARGGYQVVVFVAGLSLLVLIASRRRRKA